jgi:transposase
MNTGSASADQQIDNLKQQWDQLSDPDRALAIAQIKKFDLSQREIARRIQCSENTVRRLLSILDAPATDLAAARQGKISTNKLLKRSKAERERRAQERKKNAEQRREKQAINGAKLIVKWLREQEIPDAYDEAIIETARDKFKLAWQLGLPVPDTNAPAGLKPAEYIELCRPKRSMPENAERLVWYADWLTWWVICVFRDADVRDSALDKALPMQRKSWNSMPRPGGRMRPAANPRLSKHSRA